MIGAIKRALRAIIEPPAVVPCVCGDDPELVRAPGRRALCCYACRRCDRVPLALWEDEGQARRAWARFTDHQRRFS